MIKYNPEDLVLWNEFAKAKRAGLTEWPSSFKFSIESSFTKDEKIEAIDTYYKDSGLFKYAIELSEKWNAEKSSLPVDRDGWIRTNSLKAWLHKNDTRKLIDDWYHYGSFEIYGEVFGLSQSPNGNATRKLLADETINTLFHHFCEKQCIAEECIYLERDPKAVKFGKVRSFARMYNTFGTQMLCDFAHNLDSEEIENIDEKLLDTLITKFEAFVEIHKQFNEDFVKISKENNWREGL